MQKLAAKELFAKIKAIVGSDYLLTDKHSCSLFAQDIFTKGLPALGVARPETMEQLSALVSLVTGGGYSVIPRGGGMSYTSGYVPIDADSIVIDLSRMNRVIEVNQRDMYVTVECGCTWKELHEALKGTGLRTPYWGTLSGSRATIGGGLSQNAVFWGSGQFGSAADSVLCLEVVLADGSVVKTGAGAQVNGTPFFRHYGPDLTGLFTSDSGAMGFKARATLRLMPELPSKQYVAFDFVKAADAIDAMSEISRQGLAMECFGFDPYLQKQRLKRESLTADIKALAGVIKSAGSVLGAFKDAVSVAVSGRRYMDNVDYAVQIIIEERSDGAAKQLAEQVRKIGRQHRGREIANSIPKITRANPFGSVNNMLGPEGERWAPVHGLFPHSKIQSAFAAVEALFDKHRATIEQYSIGTGYLFATVSTHCFVLEPVFFWPDSLTEIHRDSVEADHLARLRGFSEDLDARKAVSDIRAELIELFSAMGAAHLQIGKAYCYREAILPETWQLVKAIKQVVDPEARVNPMSLGLD